MRTKLTYKQLKQIIKEEIENNSHWASSESIKNEYLKYLTKENITEFKITLNPEINKNIDNGIEAEWFIDFDIYDHEYVPSYIFGTVSFNNEKGIAIQHISTPNFWLPNNIKNIVLKNMIQYFINNDISHMINNNRKNMIKNGIKYLIKAKQKLSQQSKQQVINNDRNWIIKQDKDNNGKIIRGYRVYKNEL